jgi:hypothetical protein
MTLRDDERKERGHHLIKPDGVRIEDGRYYLLFQV